MTALETSWRVYVEPRWGPVSMVHPVDVQDWGEKGVADDCVSRLLRMLRLKGHCATPPIAIVRVVVACFGAVLAIKCGAWRKGPAPDNCPVSVNDHGRGYGSGVDQWWHLRLGVSGSSSLMS